MAGLDRALAFDRTVDQARSQAPALFPPEISCKKFMFEDGSCEHVYHHATLGEVGRVRVQGDRVTCRVAGDLGDPLAQERNAIFGPIAEQLAQAGNKRCFQSQLIPCERCGRMAAVLIFAEGPGIRDLEDCARLMYPEYSRGSAPVWIIGPSLGTDPPPERPADIMKVWPDRGPVQRLRPAEFNPLLDRFVAGHCK